MSCRRASRELLERFRFGEELDARSDPHLAHLQTCQICRDEVGLDQALISQLRRALHARVADLVPSPNAWRVVRARLSQPAAPSLFARLGRWTRLLPAGAAMALMLVVIAGSPDRAGTGARQTWTWPSQVSEREVGVPEPELPWYIRDRPPPRISSPAGGPTVGAEPAGADQDPAPSSVQRVRP